MEVRHLFSTVKTINPDSASWRLRYKVVPVDKHSDYKSVCSTEPASDALNVFHKHFIPDAPELMRKYGGILDINDNHFGKKQEGLYREMCGSADHIVCSTENLKSFISKVTDADISVVSDPIDKMEFGFSEPYYHGTNSLVWFGHPGNLWPLKDTKFPFPLHVMTDLKTIKENSGWVPDGDCYFYQWKPGITRKLLKKHDIVVLPYGDSPMQEAKSPNRMVSALWSGKMVVTNDNEVARSSGLDEFVTVDNDLAAGVMKVWENPREARHMADYGQEYITENYLPSIIAGKWINVFNKVAATL